LEETLNKMNYDISIIVPFHKRDEYGKNIFEIINNQSKKENLKIELIFVDSKSRTDLEEKISKLKNFGGIDVKIYDTIDYVSKKRNLGIAKANSENIIIMDDDCIPCENFLKNHHASLMNLQDEKQLFCGMIKYDNNLKNKSNYFRFRDEGHRKFDESYKLSKNLNFHNIVVMNMSFKKKTVQENNLKFNEEFNTYGFEDLQFGIDALFKDFQLKTNNAEVIHQDSTPLPIFQKKINSFAKTYFFLFYPYNKNRIESNNDKQNYDIISSDLKEYKILIYLSKLNLKFKNKNIFIKIFYNLMYFSSNFICVILTKILTLSDKIKFLYSYRLYKTLVHIKIISSFFGKEKINKEWLELN
jgi:hypothetical protein